MCFSITSPDTFVYKHCRITISLCAVSHIPLSFLSIQLSLCQVFYQKKTLRTPPGWEWARAIP